jgi:hypothetical protein
MPLLPLTVTHQMLQYREKATSSGEPFTETPEAPSEVPRYMTLAAQYGLGDDMDITGSGATNEQRLDRNIRDISQRHCQRKMSTF